MSIQIPNYFASKVVDDKGYFLPEWQQFFQQLISQLQTNFSPQGFLLPQLSTTQINYVATNFAASSIPSAFYGNMIYDNTLDEAKINIAGTFKVIQVV